MSLFVVRHRHDAERCPAQDPAMGAMLLKHLGAESARQHGIAIHGEAVVDGAHTLYLIAEADGRATLDRFLEPFAQAGEVDVMPASACEAVVARGSCA